MSITLQNGLAYSLRTRKTSQSKVTTGGTLFRLLVLYLKLRAEKEVGVRCTICRLAVHPTSSTSRRFVTLVEFLLELLLLSLSQICERKFDLKLNNSPRSCVDLEVSTAERKTLRNRVNLVVWAEIKRKS